MTRFVVDIEKERNGETWTNRYLLELADLTAAVSAAADIVAIERAVHFSSVTFTRSRVRTATEGDDTYVITPISGTGELDASGGSVLPLFNVARVDFAVAMGRPSRKYLRLGFTEGFIAGDVFTEPMMTELDQYADAMAALPGYVDVDGQAIISGTAFSAVAMRQLRRGSRRRATPVLD